MTINTFYFAYSFFSKFMNVSGEKGYGKGCKKI